MAEDKSQQTEQPTQRRLSQAAEKGDIVKSQEVTTFVVLLGGTLSIAIFGKSAAESFTTMFRVFLEQPDRMQVDSSGIMMLFGGTILHVGLLFAPIFAVLVGMALAGHLLQSGFVFSGERLKPDISKLSPLSGLKRIFGLEGASNLLKGILKIAIVGTAVWTTLWPMRGQLGALLDESAADMAGDMAHLIIRIMIAALAVLAIVAVLDYALQRYRFLQRNRMSKQEVKDEFRQTDGDPAVKARIRRVRLERARRRMMAAVPEATVVITNPTHYAIALKYESGKMAAPICVAKGMDALALRIRAVAEEAEVPIVENPPLARALYASVELDEVVPPEHYKAVAQVIGYVMRLTGQLRH
ncbi:MAG: flagellar biosynthesis protein FlhB [Rhizomicrobium sp.]|jgi:flagellar biosynthetic protein FlhB